MEGGRIDCSYKAQERDIWVINILQHTLIHCWLKWLPGGPHLHSHGTVDLVICVLEGCAIDDTQGVQEGLLAMEFLTLQGVTA